MTVANITGLIKLSAKVRQGKIKLLDIVPGGYLACGLFPLSSTYSGPLFQIRRSSDNVTRDFFAVGDDFPYQAFIDFVGAATPFLTTRYDQMGGGNHFIQATAANQPVVSLANGMAEIQGNASTATMNTAIVQIPASVTAFSRVKSLQATWKSVFSLFGNGFGTSGDNGLQLTMGGGTSKINFNLNSRTGSNVAATVASGTPTITNYNNYVMVIDDVKGTAACYYGATQANSSGYTAGSRSPTPTPAASNIQLGSYDNTQPTNFAEQAFVMFSRALSSAEIALVDSIMSGAYPGVLNLARAPIAATVTGQSKGSSVGTFRAPITASVKAAARAVPGATFQANMAGRLKAQAKVAPAPSFWAALTVRIGGQAKVGGAGSYPASITAAIRGGTRLAGMAVGFVWLSAAVRAMSRATGAARILYPAVPAARARMRVKLPARQIVWPDFSTLETSTRTFDVIEVLDPGNGIDAPETIVSVEDCFLTVIGPAGVTDPAPANRISGVVGVEGALISQRFGNWQDLPLIQYRATARFSTTRQDDVAVFATFSVVRPGG